MSLQRQTYFSVSRVGVPIRNTADYSPFGIQLDGRTISMDSYRYGFQNQEKDDEIKGSGNSMNFEFRMHDPRVGRFFAIDPLAAKYPYYSTYAFSGNRVIDAFELEGKEPRIIHYKRVNRDGSITELSSSRASNDNQKGCPTCAQENYDFYFFKPLGAKGYKTYSEKTERGHAGDAMKKMREDNSAFFTALEIYEKLDMAQKVQTVVDVVGVAASVATIVASAGSSSLLIAGFGLTTGTAGLGLNSTKLILDSQGKHDKSSEIPSSVGESLGMAFDDVYKMMDSKYEGKIGANIGNLAEATISIGISAKFGKLGVSDALTSAGLVSSWMKANGKPTSDYNSYLKEFKSILKEYKSISKAKSKNE